MVRFIELFPDVALQLIQALTDSAEDQLATSVPDLKVVDRCRCGDDFCAMVYTEPKPKGAYGPSLRNFHFDADERGMVILDIVDDRIMSVEILFRPGARERLLAACP